LKLKTAIEVRQGLPQLLTYAFKRLEQQASVWGLVQRGENTSTVYNELLRAKIIPSKGAGMRGPKPVPILLSERQKEIWKKSAVGIAAPTAGEKSTTDPDNGIW